MKERAEQQFLEARAVHWDAVYRARPPSWLGRYYHRQIVSLLGAIIRPGSEVLDIGCGRGDLLAALPVRRGVGVDISSVAIEQARARHQNNPALTFIPGTFPSPHLTGTFDYILLLDVVNDVWDIQRLMESVRLHCHPGTRVVLNVYSRLWEPWLRLGEWFGLKRKTLPQNWVNTGDMNNLLHLAGFEVLQSQRELLCPLPIPVVAPLLNRWLARIWPFNHACLSHFLVARLPQARSQTATVSVIVPARNEAGNMQGLLDRIPQMGGGTEVVFVEGGSQDRTWEAITEERARRPDVKTLQIRQSGRGKGDAVRAGFAAATGDLLMILDADITVSPEDLPQFFDVLVRGTAEFANGVRLVYPMEHGAMRPLNLIGNRAFSALFTWLLGAPIRDTLCGTKALWRTDYERIAAARSYFGDFDPFGDFDLLFGAARQRLKIADVPVRYGQRVYGSTNISRWRHGVLLLRMCLFAARKIKFV